MPPTTSKAAVTPVRVLLAAGLLVATLTILTTAVVAFSSTEIPTPHGPSLPTPPVPTGTPSPYPTGTPSPTRGASLVTPTTSPSGQRNPELVIVPSIAGMPASAAIDRLRQAGLLPGGYVEQDSASPEGTPIGTAPPAGGKVPAGTRVDIVIARYYTTAPNLAGWTIQQARAWAARAGVMLNMTNQAGVGDAPVANQWPPAGTRLHRGDRVNVQCVVPSPSSFPSEAGTGSGG